MVGGNRVSHVEGHISGCAVWELIFWAVVNAGTLVPSINGRVKTLHHDLGVCAVGHAVGSARVEVLAARAVAASRSVHAI